MTADDVQAEVTWTAPTNSGSFPVTNYDVRSTPAAGTCLVTELTITITGSRGTGADRQVVFVTGTSTGLDGEQVRAHVKLRGQTTYRPGRLVGVTTDGTFTWQRTTGKKTYVYFTGASVQSNRVIVPPAQA